ncbi:hypothetical protein O77CONTIG1_04285 [Leptolyngbya sp. O-77]|nr:hypothetical protein O77CONTIG1_04285 [Leptolyngbya sp. O-77]
MDAEKKAQIQAHARALAALLYEETDPEQVKRWQGLRRQCEDICSNMSAQRSGIFYCNK